MTIAPGKVVGLAAAGAWMFFCCGAAEELGIDGLGGGGDEAGEISEELAAAFIADTNANCDKSWCDEEFDYWFDRMECDPSTCTVYFTGEFHEEIKPREDSVTFLALEAVTADGELSEAFEASFWAAMIEWESGVIAANTPVEPEPVKVVPGDNAGRPIGADKRLPGGGKRGKVRRSH